MVRDIGRWLEELKLGQYASAFAENDVDLDLLFELSDDDLVKLGVNSLGHRKRLFKEIEALRPAGRAAQRPASDEPPAASRQPAAEAERRQLTVMFCDLVGSTELSGRLDPEDLREVLRQYQNAVTTAVVRYGGHVGQYLGDGVLVYFGWPRAYEDQAERAIWAGLDAISAVKAIALDDNLRLNARVGVASGPVVIGEFVDYTGQDVKAVTGKTPNLAARLQGLAGPGQMVIDADTRRLIGTAFKLENHGHHELKGISAPVSVWRVVGKGQAESRFEAAHSGHLSRFIGRERELGIMGKRWALAKTSESQVVLLSGEAGIGKSRMVQAFCDAAGDEPHILVRCQCSPFHTNSAFHPIIRLFERTAGFASNDDEASRLDKLERLLQRSSSESDINAPLFASLLSLPSEDRYGELHLSAQQIRDRTIDALIGQLVSLSRQQPVLFLLEDAHWIDPTTETLIREATRRMEDAHVLMLITQRPDDTPRWADRPNVAQIDLHKLSRANGEKLVRAAGGNELTDSVVAEILTRADGVPLFIEELTKSLLESDDDDAEIPASLNASLVARLDRLGDAAKVAQLASLLGRSFHYRFISAVSELDTVALDRALTAMTDSELLSRTGTPPRAVYVFRHALIQDAAYETLLKSKRARYHGKIAKVLLNDFASQAAAEPELVARHFSLAGIPERSAEFWLRAGQRADERSAHVEAIAHLTNGLQEIQKCSSTPSRDEQEFAIRTAMGASLLTAKGWSSSAVEDNYRRIQEIGALDSDTRKHFLALRGLCNVFVLKGEIRKARELADKQLSIALELDDSSLLLDGYRPVGMCSFFVGEFEAARESVRRANAIYDRSLHHSHKFVYGTDPAVIGLSVVAWIDWFLGDINQAQTDIQAALILAEELQHPFSLAYARSLASSVQQVSRNADAALELANGAIAVAEEYDYPYWLGWSTVMQGWALSALGRPEDGIDALRRGLDIYENTGAQLMKPYIMTLLAEMYGWAGSPDQGIDVLEGAYGPGNKSDVSFYESEALRIHGELQRQSKSGDGQEYFRQSIALARRQGARAIELRAATSIARASLDGRDREAVRAAQVLLSELCQSFDSGLGGPDLLDAHSVLKDLRAAKQ